MLFGHLLIHLMDFPCFETAKFCFKTRKIHFLIFLGESLLDFLRESPLPKIVRKLYDKRTI